MITIQKDKDGLVSYSFLVGRMSFRHRVSIDRFKELVKGKPMDPLVGNEKYNTRAGNYLFNMVEEEPSRTPENAPSEPVQKKTRKSTRTTSKAPQTRKTRGKKVNA